MELIDSLKERYKIKRIISRAVSYIVSQLEHKGLIAIYKTGTILTKDQVYDSDIDLAVFVASGFDFNEVNVINEYFEHHKEDIGEGFKIGIIAFGMDEITKPYNSKTNNPITELKLTYRMLKALSYYGELRWGKRLPLKKFVQEFSHENDSYFTPLEEAKNQIHYIQSEIKKIRLGDYTNYRKLPKYCLVLIRCEAILEYNFTYDPLFYKLYAHMKYLDNHFIHKCMKLRAKSTFTPKEALAFCKELEEYINTCQQKIRSKLWQ